MPRKILVNYLGRKGGGALYSYEMSKALAEAGNEVYAIIPKTNDNLEDWQNSSKIKVIAIDTYNDKVSFIIGLFRFLLKTRREIRKQLKGIVFDVCYIPMQQPWAELVNRCIRYKELIVTVHDPIPHEGSGKLMNYLYDRVAKAADKIVILSSVFEDVAVKRYGKERRNIYVIPHGVFDKYGKYESTPIQRTEEYNFLFFGRITPYKGLELLAKAYVKLYMERHDISLYVVGSGNISPYKNMFPEDKNITIINRYIDDEEVSSFFSGKNVITILPYTDASQSGVIPIAMKERSQLIVSGTGGLVEQTGNGKYAILTEPNEHALYDKMKYAIEHYDELDSMRNNAKVYIESLSWDNLAKQLVSIM